MSKGIRHRVVFGCLSVAVLVVVVLCVDYNRNSEFRAAAAWHKIHGNTILVDGHKLSLPQDWWGKDEQEGGKYLFVMASRDLTHVSQSGIIIDRKGIEESKASEDEIRKTLESFVQSDKKAGNNIIVSSLVVIKAVSTNIYCLRRSLDGKNIELRCDVAGAPIAILSIGPPSTVKEIEAIISTFD